MGSKVKSVYKYNLYSQSKPIVTYYLIVLAVIVLFSLLNLTGNFNFTMNGFELTSIIFVLVLSLVDFGENFNMLSINNVSRSNIFTGKILSLTTLALFMAVLDRIIITVASLSSLNFGSLFETVFSTSFSSGAFAKNAEILLMSFVAYISIAAFGTFLSILFYRAHKAGKVLIAAGVPITVFIIMPIVLSLMSQTKAGSDLMIFLAKLIRTPLNFTLTAIVSTLVLGFIDWLLLRRISVKKQDN